MSEDTLGGRLLVGVLRHCRERFLVGVLRHCRGKVVGGCLKTL